MLSTYTGFEINGKNDNEIKKFVQSINHYKYFHKIAKNFKGFEFSRLYRLTKLNKGYKLTKYEYNSKTDNQKAYTSYVINKDVIFNIKTIDFFKY